MFDQGKTGRLIAESRKQLDLTQKDLAEKLGISDKTISKWETGHGMRTVLICSKGRSPAKSTGFCLSAF